MFFNAELNEGLLLIPQYSDSQIYLSSSLHLPGYRSENKKILSKSALVPFNLCIWKETSLRGHQIASLESNEYLDQKHKCVIQTKAFWWLSFLSEESASTDFSSLLKNCRKQSLFQSFFPSAKILPDKCCGTVAAKVVFNGLQKKCRSCSYLLSSGKSLLLQLEAATRTALRQTVSWDRAKLCWQDTSTWKFWDVLKGTLLCKHSVMHRNGFCPPGLWHFG